MARLVIEQVKLIGPLTDPTAHGASAADAFHLVIPSMPGYGFSGKPTDPGWAPVRIGRAYAELMRRLGYTAFVAQGGDWGADRRGDGRRPRRRRELIGIHTNLAGAISGPTSKSRPGRWPAALGPLDDEE